MLAKKVGERDQRRLGAPEASQRGTFFREAIKPAISYKCLILLGALGEIRTPDPRNRNPMLYPAELRAREGLPDIRVEWKVLCLAPA